MTKLATTVLFLVALFLADRADAGLKISRIDDSCVVTINGEISAADADKLESNVCRRPSIVLNNSPGGDVRAGMKIGRWARAHQAVTIVGKEQHCYSTCALVFIGGIDRINTGVIGLHRPYLAGVPLPEEAIPGVVSAMRDEVRAYISEMGARPEFASVMLETLPEQMRLYQESDIHELVAERDAVYDEVEASRMAHYYGTSTDEYRRRKHEASEECDLNKFLYPGGAIAQDICERAMLWGLTQSVFLRRRDSISERCGHLATATNGRNESHEARLYECRQAVMRGE